MPTVTPVEDTHAVPSWWRYVAISAVSVMMAGAGFWLMLARNVVTVDEMKSYVSQVLISDVQAQRRDMQEVRVMLKDLLGAQQQTEKNLGNLTTEVRILHGIGLYNSTPIQPKPSK